MVWFGNLTKGTYFVNKWVGDKKKQDNNQAWIQ